MDSLNPDIIRALRNGQTVKELRELLDHYDDDMIVGFKYNSNDHWRTVIAIPVTQADVEEVKYSGYHSKLSIADDADGDDTQRILILS